MSLTVKTLFKRYGDNWILKDVSFDVNPGEIFGIFGPTGAGKSVLLNLLAGTERPNSGFIEWQGRNVTELKESDRGFVLNTDTKSNGWRHLFSGNSKHQFRGTQK